MATRISVSVDIDSDVTVAKPTTDYPEQIRIWGDSCDALLYVRTPEAARRLAAQLIRSAELLEARVVAKDLAAQAAAARTCDWCDKPMIGGAAGGGLPSQHWCADHEPDVTLTDGAA